MSDAKSDRDARRAAALRENLKRRKAAARKPPAESAMKPDAKPGKGK